MDNHMNLWLSDPEQLLDDPAILSCSLYVNLNPIRAGPFPSLRLSNKGFLPMTLEDYLRLLDWTGRQTRPDKPGAIPAVLASILDRLGIKASAWPETVNKFTSSFGPFAGRPESLARKAGP